jgi:hypothetical protein
VIPEPDPPSQARPDRTTPDAVSAHAEPPFDPEDRFGNSEHIDWRQEDWWQELEADDGEEI